MTNLSASPRPGRKIVNLPKRDPAILHLVFQSHLRTTIHFTLYDQSMTVNYLKELISHNGTTPPVESNHHQGAQCIGEE